MTSKHYTTCKIVSTICLVICGVLSLYHFQSAPSAGNPHNEVVAPSIQAPYTRASTVNMASSSFLDNIKSHFTQQAIFSVAIIAIIVVVVIQIISSQRQYNNENDDNATENAPPVKSLDENNDKATENNENPPPAKSLDDNTDDENKFLWRIYHMITGAAPNEQNIPMKDKYIGQIKQLLSLKSPKPLPKGWNSFLNGQKCITLDMQYMYKYYNELRALLFSEQFTNLLKIDAILKIFPNVETIICEEVDKIAHGVSDDIGNQNFISGLQAFLQQDTKQLKKVIFRTDQEEIKYNLASSHIQGTQWYIGQGKKTIVCTTTRYDDFVSKTLSMIQGSEPLDEATSLDKAMLAALVADTGDTPPDDIQIAPDKKKRWQTFTNKQKHITFDMAYMYSHYEALRPLFFSKKPTNLLQVAAILKIFPNVETIVCTKMDSYSALGTPAYKPGIINATFIQGLKSMLPKANQSYMLKKIILRTLQYPIQDALGLSFGAPGWKINQEPYDPYGGYGFAPKNFQISITKSKS